MKRLLVLAVTLGALAACQETPMGPAAVTPPPGAVQDTLPEAAPFDPAAFAWSTAPGRASLTGVLAYRREGLQYTCRGEDVLLIPDAPWSRRRMIILYGAANSAALPVAIVRARSASAPPGDYARFVRRTTCDAEGRFGFDGLPDGAWYVVTVARPLNATGEPMALTRRVELRSGVRAITLP